MGTHRRRSLLAPGLATLILLSGAAAEGAGGDFIRSFGRGGIAKVDLPDQDVPQSIAVQRDGRLVLAGISARDDSSRIGIVRLLRNGRIDRSFRGTGRALLPLGDYAYGAGLGLGTDGSIVLGAWIHKYRPYTGDESADGWPQFALDGWRFALVKLKPNGSFDSRFGRGGIVMTQTDELRPFHDYPVDLAVLPDGSILVLAVTGRASGYAYAGTVALLRYTRTGALDTSFGVQGVAPLSSNVFAARDLAVQRDGRIVVGWTIATGATLDWAVSRFLPTGAPDSAFGAAGTARVGALPGGDNVLRGVEVQRDGKILAFGDMEKDRGWTAAIARLNADGTPDTGFGTGGEKRLFVGTWDSVFTDAVVQEDGKVVAGLTVYKDFQGTRMVARFLPNGNLDGSFGRRGLKELPLFSTVHLGLASGRIIAAGSGAFRLEYEPGVTYFLPETFAAAALTQ